MKLTIKLNLIALITSKNTEFGMRIPSEYFYKDKWLNMIQIDKDNAFDVLQNSQIKKSLSKYVPINLTSFFN